MLMLIVMILVLGIALGLVAGHLLTLRFYHQPHRHLCPEYVQVPGGWVCVSNKESCFIAKQIEKEKEDDDQS